MSLSFSVLPTVANLHALLAEFAGQTPEAVVRGLISLAPTRHTVALNSGTRIFTYCTLDTLLIPRLLGEDARLCSESPKTAEPLHYAIEGGHLQAPAAWCLSFPVIGASPAHEGAFKGNFCPYTNAFANADAYARWAARETVPTTPLTFAQADALARDYTARIQAEAPQVCGCGCGV